MKKFTVYTETKPNIADIVSLYFQAFTLSQSEGHWNGMKEAGSQIVILTDKPEDEEKIRAIAQEIKFYNNQEAVLVTVEECAGYFA